MEWLQRKKVYLYLFKFESSPLLCASMSWLTISDTVIIISSAREATGAVIAKRQYSQLDRKRKSENRVLQLGRTYDDFERDRDDEWEDFHAEMVKWTPQLY